MRNVDVVVPVYDGYEESKRCIESALATIDSAWARLVLINDASPSPELSAYMRDLASHNSSVVLLENLQNLGFVGTANRGLKYDLERDVLLLNADVEVANDWLERLRNLAYHQESVASLTPFSNNATIFSFPNFCEDNELAFGLGVGEIDRFFGDHFSVEDVLPVPTGVGCCMYMRRDCLNVVGYLDEETFGRGYGEENDWCQRAERAGWRNFLAPNCFVYHAGGVSFGAEQTERVEKAQQLLAKKHPNYAADVAQFLAADPARDKRVRALLGLMAQQNKPKILMLCHKLGGGAQQHVDELALLYGKEALFLQITPQEEGRSVSLTFFAAAKQLHDGLYFDIESEYDKLLGLLRELGVGRLHFHHTMGLPPRLWLLAEDLGLAYDVTIHDYYLINGNPTLTDEDARYVEAQGTEFDDQCGGHYPLPEGVSADHWRDSQRMLLDGAARLIFPSQDACSRMSQFFSIDKSVVAWHPDYAASQPYPSPNWNFPSDRPLRVLVMGAMSREKGADVLDEVAQALAEENIEFHLLGYAYRALSENVVTHGPYVNADVYKLVEDIAPDVVWFPALWPETYSYTLSIALHQGLPVVVPNIGAFVERVQGREHSAVVDWGQSTAQWRDLWVQILAQQRLPAQAQQNLVSLAALDSDFYRSDYLSATTASVGQLQESTLASITGNYYLSKQQLSFSERVLKRIWRMSRSPMVAAVVAKVPFGLKQAFKRRLSRRPMHDIVHKD